MAAVHFCALRGYRLGLKLRRQPERIAHRHRADSHRPARSISASKAPCSLLNCDASRSARIDDFQMRLNFGMSKLSVWLPVFQVAFLCSVSAQGTVPTFQYQSSHGSLTLVGHEPARGETTVVPTVLVPVTLLFDAQ